MTSPTGSERFSTTPRGSVATARRRRARLLVGLAALMGSVFIGTLVSGQFMPALLALVAGVAPLFAWRWTSDGDLLWLDLASGELAVQLKGGRERLVLAGASVRPLEASEIDHLEHLISGSGFGAGSGSFDSRLFGEVDLFATDLAQAVLIESGEERMIVTPDDRQRFLERIRQGAQA